MINIKTIVRFLKTKCASKRRVHRTIGVFLIAIATATIFIHNFSNIGGNFVLAFNTPTASIDASTEYRVQAPITYSYESRGVSWFHAGADLVAPTGTPVYPIMIGTVEEVNHYAYGFGNHVILKHADGYESIYGHLSKTEVEAGQKVTLDTELGKSGSTGFSTGPHLHLEIHQNGSIVNPADMVPGVK
ncbi:M23 family metallopeptidase [Candidatus Microgenomates bacterium]|nr:M23 family metallopeptidase [Candidatus Microgenomates bacterium]